MPSLIIFVRGLSIGNYYWRANPNQCINLLTGIKNSALKKSLKTIAFSSTMYPNKEDDEKVIEKLGLNHIKFHYYYD